MKATELRQKSVSELTQLRAELQKEQFNLRMQKASQAVNKKTHLMKVARRDVARIETILKEKAGQS